MVVYIFLVVLYFFFFFFLDCGGSLLLLVVLEVIVVKKGKRYAKDLPDPVGAARMTLLVTAVVFFVVVNR